MGTLATLFTGPPKQKMPIVKPLPINSSSSQASVTRQALSSGGAGDTILTSPLGISDGNNASTTLLGT